MRGFALFAIVLLLTIPISTAVSVRLVRSIPETIDTKVAAKTFIVTLEFEVEPQGEKYVKGMFKCPEMGNIVGVPVMFDDDSLTPTVQFKSKPVRELIVKCTFYAVISDQVRAQNFSIEKKIDIGDNPLGDVVQAQSKKINAVTQRIAEVEDKIDSLQRLVDIFGIWCTISKMLAKIGTMISNLKLAIFLFFSFEEKACLASIVCAPFVEVVAWQPWAGICSVTTRIVHFIDEFIWPQGFLRFEAPIGTINKWGCSIFFDCLLANVNQMASIAVEGVNKIDAVQKFNSKVATKIKNLFPAAAKLRKVRMEALSLQKEKIGRRSKKGINKTEEQRLKRIIKTLVEPTLNPPRRQSQKVRQMQVQNALVRLLALKTAK